MGNKKFILLCTGLIAFLRSGDGCQMEGILDWRLPETAQILDVHRGVFFNRSTTDIEEIGGINTGEGVNAALYLSVSLQESTFLITTTTAYELYEENETSTSISFSVVFRCTGGQTETLVFDVLVVDTNNNPPTFRPNDEYEFTITPPLPPGFQITGCGDDNIIVVRDIDLTTQRIDFEIQENDYFEIEYNGRSTTDPKEFLALLRTKNLIRTLPEVVELTILATDVDQTGDPPITTTAIIRIQANDDFQFPDEPIFSQPFYLATYTETNQLVIQETITLQQGFDDQVIFTLEGENLDHFMLSASGNEVSIGVVSPLTTEILRSGRIVLVVRAEREYTSGTTATVIVQLPEVPGLEFEQTHYEGSIVDNVLQSIQLTLQQGYEGGFDVTLLSEHASFFAANVNGNVITLSMSPLSSTVIDANNFISLQVVTSNQYSSATAIVTLNIIKDDNVTPVFERAVYTGDYNQATGLTLEQIVLVQGYDDSVSFSLEEEHAPYFQINNDGPQVLVTSSGIPTSLWVEQQLLLTIEAIKPRSVSASAAISIRLPSARELAFESDTYRGTLQDANLSLQSIILSDGYSEEVTFTLSGDYVEYFTLSNVQNQVTLNLTPLPDDVILGNNILTLRLSASGLHAIPTSAAVVLEIIKQDVTTPVFTENIYRAVYLGNAIEIGNISLAQGFDSTVTFRLDGEHSEYFSISNTGNDLSLELQTGIPLEVIFREKVLLFNVLADKPLSVGANAAVYVTFPQELTEATEMRFSQNTYVGTLEDSLLTIENIVLETGFETGTNFTLTGDYASYFSIQNTENAISITISDAIPDEVIEDNNFIILEIEATRYRAVSTTASIIIDILEEEIVPPVFSESFYRGVYADNEMQFDDEIALSQGYDETVSFVLEGAYSIWFSISSNGNLVTVTRINDVTIPEEVLENNSQLLFTIVAIKPGTINATAAISIDLPKEIPEPVVMRFTQSSYVGSIDNGELYAPNITLLGDRDPIQFNLTGDFASYFGVSHIANNVQLQLTTQIPEEEMENLAFIILDIHASYPEAINGYTTVVLEIIKQPQIVTPVFERAYYIGEYSVQEGLHLGESIQLIQGFDESVLFTLAGDDAQWFELTFNEQNNLTLNVRDTDLEQIRDRSHLVFSVIAYKTESVSGRAAVIINLADLITTVPLRFQQNYYRGLIENSNLTVSTINLVEGYLPEITVSFTGDHVDYFQLTHQEGLFTLQLLSELPDDITEANNVLIFTLEAQIDDTRAHTTVILELVKIQSAPLAFEEAYYVGSYSIISGFTFDPQITLTEYDETVSFSLEGEDAQWFGLAEDQNSVSITQENPIPFEVLSNNQHLVFAIVAEGPDNVTARSTIIISIIDDTVILGFESNIYIGSIQNNEASMDSIVLINGYSEAVTFGLLGELEDYFNLTQEASLITVSLQNEIPDELIPANRIISLELQASAPQAINAYATLVFGTIENEIEPLSFDETYYTGRYSEVDGLEFPEPIVLSEGYNGNVQFTLEGESAQYFEPVVSNNTVTLRIATPIPQAVVMNSQQLVFTIRADRNDNVTARATIVIALIHEIADDIVLGFDRIAYVGSIRNDTLNLDPISLSEGYSENVSFTLYGNLSSYFDLINEQGLVTIILPYPIPEEALPSNGIVILELIATSAESTYAYATIVLQIIEEEITQPVFSRTYYNGDYRQADGLTFDEAITLVEGYDESVQFTLEGDENTQYFELIIAENSVLLQVTSPIPTTVLLNNHQLIFTIRVDKLDVRTVRVPIVISLLDINLDEIVLRFDQVAYLGSIDNETLTLDQITLSDGFSSDVSFRLLGDLETYFAVSNEDENITITLISPIPESLIPDNNIILLELQASVPQMVTGYAAIVINVVKELSILRFEQIAYIGTIESGESTLEPVLLNSRLTQNVTFRLQGELADYFILNASEGTTLITLQNQIPEESLPNNRLILLELEALAQDTVSAYTAIIFKVIEEDIENVEPIVFSEHYYTGHYTVLDGLIFEETITLATGSNENTVFGLEGDSAQYFEPVITGNSISLRIVTPIPPAVISNNQHLIFVISAGRTGAITARATIIISLYDEIPVNDDIIILGFERITYVGRIENNSVIVNPILLSVGYSSNVTFSLFGDLANFFIISNEEATINITLQNTIPEESVPENRIVLLELQASAPNSVSAHAAIVFEVNIEPLTFSEHYYTGHYTEVDGLTFEESITLATGYNENVVFALEGDSAQYFELVTTGNSISLRVATPIPPAVISNNRHLIFAVNAEKTSTISAKAIIVISLYDEIPINDDDFLILGFERITYVGRIENNLVVINPILLSEGYSSNVTFNIFGDLLSYFTISNEEATITIILQNPIPEELVPENRIILLELQASAPNSVSAHAAIVFEVDIEPLTFSEHYYTGHYTEIDGLSFEESITLATGYNEDVVFALEGDSAQYFELVTTGNSVLLRVVTPIPPAVISNNQQLILVINAVRSSALTARAIIVISLYDEIPINDDDLIMLGFERITYVGRIENNSAIINPILLREGYSSNVTFSIFGDLGNYFTLSNEESTVAIILPTPIPEELVPENRIILLELQASAPNSVSAHAAIVFEVIPVELIPNFDILEFSQTYYTGHYIEREGLTFGDTISLTEGFNENIQFVLEGDNSQYFSTVILSENSVSLSLVTAIPPAIVSNNQQLVFTIRAERPDAITTRATIVISLYDEFTEDAILGFDRITYQGTIEDTTINIIDRIRLSEGYNENVSFILHGALASFFNVSSIDSTVTIILLNPIPEQWIPDNKIIVLELQATIPDTLSAYAAIILKVITPNIDQLEFSQTYYTGYYVEAEGLTFEDTIALTEGFNTNVQFTLEGDSSQYFETVVTENAILLRLAIPIPPAIVSNNQQLIFTIRADRLNGITARATIVIALIDEPSEDIILSFSRISYAGQIENNLVNIDVIVLSEGYTENVSFILHGELSQYFTISPEGATVVITLQSAIPEDSLPSNRIVILELQAVAPETMSAFTTIVFEVVQEVMEEMIFSEPFYTGRYTEESELVLDDNIALAQGFDDTIIFTLEGDQAQWFQLVATENSVSIYLPSPIPQVVVDNNRKLIFVVVAQKPEKTPIRAAIIISIYTSAEDCRPDDGAWFERVLFEGLVQGGIVHHEVITLSGYTGTNVQILGEYAELFEASHANGVVTIHTVGSITLATDILYVPLELRAGSASAVLLLDIIHSEEPALPLVEFSSASYIVRVEISQIGLIGRVQATADNGEAVTYSLAVENAHLQQRISINQYGELHLSAPVNSGVYTFNAVATTTISQAIGTAAVHLTVEAITECGENNFVLPPLIILDRDEESEHRNLVVLNSTQFAGCSFQLNNRWPIDQSWLYVDENGLHTTAIDREHESIAFMALSQVQVELILECDSDGTTRAKRSESSAARLDHLGPYDYGDNKWILTDSILYNPRRSIVNLMVNDINDNAPIFNGKENEPIVVGYPISDLEDRILPRALAEVEASDADAGENAALVYWSSAEFVAVSPLSGLVHVRNSEQLENETVLTVHATDRNGQGLTGSLDLLVKLLDTNHIAVVTVRQAFLEDESSILADISAAVGYEVKALQSVVIPDVQSEEAEQRRKREAVLSTGASLQVYIYGLIERDPVYVQQLTEDIGTSTITAVNIASTVSLEDHLEGIEICALAGHDTGLLVATIVLSVLLFILIVVAAVWFFLRWRQKQKYEEFSDQNSLESPDDSVSTRPKPVEGSALPIAATKPRINIEDLKRSKRRFQEMLEAPVEEITVQSTVAPKTPEAKVDIPEPPIVIQSIDKLKDVDDSEDEDEYGERAKGKRKSVVTFNENVEKIIHVEDTPDEAEYEVYKL